MKGTQKKPKKRQKRARPKRTRVARGLSMNNAAKYIQDVQHRKMTASNRAKQAHEQRYSRKTKLLKILEEYTNPENQQQFPEIVDNIFENEDFQRSPSPSMYDIPSNKNAKKIIADFDIFGISSIFMNKWFNVHEQGQYNRKGQKTPTKKEIQRKFALNNKQMKSFLKKILRDDMDELSYDFIFPNNGEYAFANLPWYVIYGLLNHIRDALEYQEYENIHYYLIILNPNTPDLVNLSMNIDTYFNIDDLLYFFPYLKKEIEKKQHQLMPIP